ncbi:MAG TPA: chlorite dismutase family protein [Dehalococcoidia bacterium]|jgi:chlorite dismutase|nr:chlorite dismutase family protein [Dehalococcoidia bacterium]
MKTSEGKSPESKGRRQVVKFSFYRIDPAWRAIAPEQRERGKAELVAAVEGFSDRLQVRSYSVAGMRGDADFLLWQIGDRLDDIQQLASTINGTSIGPYLTMPHSYLAMTRRSVYVSGDERRERLELHPADSKYFFVYPFVKTREWYQLALEERQKMMDEHIRIGRNYPSVKLNTTYSFGLDDQEFVVSFETDEPADFLDLVMELREAKTSLYTERDTPIFTCIAMGLREALDTLGGVGDATIADVERPTNGAGWTPVASVHDVPEGGSRVVYCGGDQVALFNARGAFYAIANRCSHANGPLADGAVEGTTVTCPYHGSQFDLASGQPLCGPASRPMARFHVRVDGGQVYLAPKEGLPEQTAGGHS